jgi:hypothetical protein
MMSELEGLKKSVKGLQKGTDKQIGQLSNDIKRILELKEQGFDERGIQRELFLDSLMGQNTSAVPVPDKDEPTGGGGQPKAVVFTSADAIAQAEEYGVPVDAAFINLLRDKNLSKEKVRDYILEQKKPPKEVNPADVIQSSTKGGTPQKSVESMTQEYIQKAKGARGNRSALMQIKDEYRQKGVDVFNVDFT